MIRFYLGTHEPGWLSRMDVPLFISERRLRRRVSMPVAVGRWALDSGGFSELDQHGSWDHGPSPREYVARVRRYSQEIGGLDFAAPQDWMCEPWITAKTGLSVAEHQARTVGNYLELRALGPELPIIPVLQGWELRDYVACVDRYARAGVDLAAAPTVGLGSVCRRQATSQIAALVGEIAGTGIRLHGFGVKTSGLGVYGNHLSSADSMAWSFRARKHEPMPGHTHKACNNCPEFALQWRENMLAAVERPFQPSLFDQGAA